MKREWPKFTYINIFEMKITYHEEQRFTQWWIWVMLVGMTFIPIVGIYRQLILGIPFGNNPMPDFGLFIFLALMIGMIIFFRSVRLITDIDDEAVRMRFIPFLVKKNLKWNEIKSIEVVRYGFVGYGIRLGSKYGIVYNTNGRDGIAIVTNEGRKFVIGTQNKEEVRSVIEKLKVNTSMH
jgi:hypothetical protein